MSERFPSLWVSNFSASKASFEVMLDVATPMDSSVSEKLESLVNLFSIVGGRGGFALSGVSPIQSQLLFAHSNSDLMDGYSCRLKSSYFDRRAFQLLRNMLVRLRLQGIEVTRINIIEVGQNEEGLVKLPEPDSINEYEIYPELSLHLGFRVEGEDSDFSKPRRCLLELCNPVESSYVIGLGDWVKPWYLKLEAGAFALPVGLPDETDSISGSVTIFDEFTVEISVDRFQASETAFFVLINMLGAYTYHSIPVAKVVLD